MHLGVILNAFYEKSYFVILFSHIRPSLTTSKKGLTKYNIRNKKCDNKNLLNCIVSLFYHF